jgi:hypothetical protein
MPGPRTAELQVGEEILGIYGFKSKAYNQFNFSFSFIVWKPPQ